MKKLKKGIYNLKIIDIINNAIEIANMATMVKRPNTPDCGSGIRAFESR